MAEYWIAHARGPDFGRLRSLGFLVLYPALDDYVFLEATEKNKALTRKQSELCVHFLKKKNELITVDRQEIERMMSSSARGLEVGEEILVVEGVGSNLEGIVLGRNGSKLKVRLEGYRRQYEIEVDEMEAVRKDGSNTDS